MKLFSFLATASTVSACDTIATVLARGVPDITVSGGWDHYTVGGSTQSSITQYDSSSSYLLGYYSYTSSGVSYYNSGDYCGAINAGRSAELHWSCGNNHLQVVSASEPSICNYRLEAEVDCCLGFSTDECSDGSHNCDSDAYCTDTTSSFTCTCNSGYSGSGTYCSDDDECSSGTHNCDGNAYCSNYSGGFSCSCNSGYSGSGTYCSDEDECSLGTDNCDANASCFNNAGSFSCLCNGGYSGSGTSCYDDDECASGNNNCDANASCTNLVGSYSCACDSGYSGSGTSCTDDDECALGTDNCDADASCTNYAGSFSCACNAGYSGSGTSCTDDDECSLGTDNCDADATCTNNPGSFSCACNTGYSGDGVTCTDIDECATGADNCDADATCANTVGSFTCTCNTGYSGDGVTCTDIDECATGADNCDANATCTNTVGSFTCACNQEYNGDGVTCIAYAGPCPSQTCWTWDAANNKCDLNPGCSAVECHATSMTMYFNKWLLNSALTMSNGIAGLSPGGAVANNNTAYPDMDYSIECVMGQCNMKSSINGSDLILGVDLAQDGSNRVRSALDNEITLGGVTIETAPHGVSVTFSCVYDTSVSVDSAAFDVHDVAIHGETQGTGDLKAGFAVTFSNAASSGKFILGGVQGVHVTWSVSLTGVTFFLDSCDVVDGSTSLSIVKGACYSDLLKTTRLTQAAGVTDVQSLEYKTFQLKGSTGTGLKVQCTVTICNSATSCADPTTCPDTGADAAYGYSVNGFNGPRLSSEWTTNTP